MLLLQSNAIPSHDRFVERQSWFRAIPFDELTNRMIVGTLGARRDLAVRTADFDCSRSGSLRTVFGAFFLLGFKNLAIGAASFCRVKKDRFRSLFSGHQRIYRS